MQRPQEFEKMAPMNSIFASRKPYHKIVFREKVSVGSDAPLFKKRNEVSEK